MKALISPNEPRETGYRVADISVNGFGVAQPLFWVDCSDDIVPDKFWYDPVDQTFKLVPLPEPEPEQPISEGTQDL
jgi:hypothetical protein